MIVTIVNNYVLGFYKPKENETLLNVDVDDFDIEIGYCSFVGRKTIKGIRFNNELYHTIHIANTRKEMEGPTNHVDMGSSLYHKTTYACLCLENVYSYQLMKPIIEKLKEKDLKVYSDLKHIRLYMVTGRDENSERYYKIERNKVDLIFDWNYNSTAINLYLDSVRIINTNETYIPSTCD